MDARNIANPHLREHSVSGILGLLDVTKIAWGNYPTLWKGQFDGKEGYPIICLEAAVDHNLLF